MDADEREIFEFLKSRGELFVNAREVARRAGGKRKYNEHTEWAKVVLIRMVERGILESDLTGRYRIKRVAKKNTQARWVSPDFAKILDLSHVKLPGQETVGSDEYYDQL